MFSPSENSLIHKKEPLAESKTENGKLTQRKNELWAPAKVCFPLPDLQGEVRGAWGQLTLGILAGPGNGQNSNRFWPSCPRKYNPGNRKLLRPLFDIESPVCLILKLSHNYHARTHAHTHKRIHTHTRVLHYGAVESRLLRPIHKYQLSDWKVKRGAFWVPPDTQMLGAGRRNLWGWRLLFFPPCLERRPPKLSIT